MTTRKTKSRMSALLAALVILAASFPALAEGMDKNVTITIPADTIDVTEAAVTDAVPEFAATEPEPAEETAPTAEAAPAAEPEAAEETAAEAAPEPATEPETAEETVAEATTEPAAEPETAGETAAEAAPEPTAEPETAGETVAEATTEPAAEPETAEETTAEATPEPATEPEAAGETAAEPEPADGQDAAAPETEAGPAVEQDSSEEKTETEDEYEDFADFPVTDFEEFEDGDGGYVTPEMLQSFDAIANAERIPFSGSAEIQLKNSGTIRLGDRVTLQAVLRNVNMDCRIVWEANDSDERGWFEVGNGTEYSYTLTAENMTREYRVVLFTAN